jgi:hypothetical protein
MLTLEALQRQLNRISYKPGFGFRLYEHRHGEGVWIAITALLPNSYKPEESTVICVRSPVPPIPTGAYFFEWLSWRVRRLEAHEVAEWFKVDGQPLHDPHAPDANE